MSPFEYVLPLVSVVVGLAVADLAVSLHRLLRAGRRVRWDALPLGAALLALLSVLELWWMLYGSQEAPAFGSLGWFLPLVAQLVLLFLLNAAALPDRIPREGLDLRAFYDRNGRYFWGLYGTYVGFVSVFRVVHILLGNGKPWGGLVPNVVLLALILALARWRSRPFHFVAMAVLLALLLVEWSQLTLGG
jgi:hypothetical protein